MKLLSEYLWCPGYVEEARAAGLQAVALLEPRGPAASWASRTTRWRSSPGRRRGPTRRGSGVAGYSRLRPPRATPSSRLSPHEKGSELAFEKALEHDLITRAGAIQLGLAAEPLWHRRYADADRNGRAALAFCSDHGLELYRHYVLSWLATGALEQGRWDEAVDWADQIIRTPRASTSASHPRVDDDRPRARAPRRSRPVVAARRGVRPRDRGAANLRRIAPPFGCARRGRVARGSRLGDRGADRRGL